MRPRCSSFDSQGKSLRSFVYVAMSYNSESLDLKRINLRDCRYVTKVTIDSKTNRSIVKRVSDLCNSHCLVRCVVTDVVVSSFDGRQIPAASAGQIDAESRRTGSSTVLVAVASADTLTGQREIAVIAALIRSLLMALLLLRERGRTWRPPSLNNRIVLLNHVAKIVITIIITPSTVIAATTSAEHRRRVVGRQGRLRENAQRTDDGDESTLLFDNVRTSRRTDERMHRRLSRWFLFTNPRQPIATAGLIIHFDD